MSFFTFQKFLKWPISNFFCESLYILGVMKNVSSDRKKPVSRPEIEYNEWTESHISGYWRLMK